METKKIHVRVGTPSLPEILQELAALLNCDDWQRHSTKDENAFYYVLGVKAQTSDQEGAQEFDTLSVPVPQVVSPLRESQVHAQVARRRSTKYYVDLAVGKLEDCGVDGETISRFVQGARGAKVDWTPLAGVFAHPAQFAAFANLLQALVMEKGLEPDDDTSESEKMREMQHAVQKLYLMELSQLYEHVVRRAASLETLKFNNAQLNEASRCFLYGFFRGTVILSASALESVLRIALGVRGMKQVDRRSQASGNVGFFTHLVDEAASQNILGPRERLGEEPALVVYSRRIFEERTSVVHKDSVPTKDVAEELLTKARQVIEYAHNRGPSPGAR